jgi:hypothetical protein
MISTHDKEFLQSCGIALVGLIEVKQRPAREYVDKPSCTCFLGHPPCGFCENYDPDAEVTDD